MAPVSPVRVYPSNKVLCHRLPHLEQKNKPDRFCHWKAQTTLSLRRKCQAGRTLLQTALVSITCVCGSETGVMDRASYAIRQNKLTFLLTTPLRSGNEIEGCVYRHGDGVKALPFGCKTRHNPERNHHQGCRVIWSQSE
jgi:hypothetical protein